PCARPAGRTAPPIRRGTPHPHTGPAAVPGWSCRTRAAPTGSWSGRGRPLSSAAARTPAPAGAAGQPFHPGCADACARQAAALLRRGNPAGRRPEAAWGNVQRTRGDCPAKTGRTRYQVVPGRACERPGPHGTGRALLQGGQLPVDPADDFPELVDAARLAARLDLETVRHRGGILAMAGPGVPLLVHQPAVTGIGALVAVLGLAALVHAEGARHLDQAGHGGHVSILDAVAAGAIGAGIFHAGFAHLHAHGAAAAGRNRLALKSAQLLGKERAQLVRRNAFHRLAIGAAARE